MLLNLVIQTLTQSEQSHLSLKIRQRIIYLENKNKLLKKPHNGKNSYYLTHFSPVSHFYIPWKRQETKGFLTFSGGIEMWHWTKMG